MTLNQTRYLTHSSLTFLARFGAKLTQSVCNTVHTCSMRSDHLPETSRKLQRSYAIRDRKHATIFSPSWTFGSGPASLDDVAVNFSCGVTPRPFLGSILLALLNRQQPIAFRGNLVQNS